MLTHILDIIGAILSFTATLCFVRVNLLAWPLSILSISIDIYLYGSKGIYGDTSIHIIYFALTIYGWYQWKYGGTKKNELPITNLNLQLFNRLMIIAIIGISCGYFILANYTDSQVPLLDAATTVLSLIAQWLICRKIVQNWVLWFIVDAMYLEMYIYKGIPAHGILQIVYLGLATVGYLRWRKQAANSAALTTA